MRLWASFLGLDLPPARSFAETRHERLQHERLQHERLRHEPLRHEPQESDPPKVSPWTYESSALPEQGWFALPPLMEASGLAAAGGDAVAVEASAPGGRAVFLLRAGGGDLPEYTLEVVLRGAGADLPVMSVVKYTGAGGGEQVLLVPTVRGPLGSAAGLVRLPGFTAGSAAGWTACAPAPVTSGATWDTATVAASVRAALNEATRAAWRQVRELVGEDLQAVIDGELR
ncbi:hypothetical protein J2S46_000571 [Kitasatospora herbaricolor]|uniref:hypothetical protein n=1 Tax=Kitasatospora herbaricolor TaxID=68217 RepID=UPI00279350BC|nr:hypothetical protein [Kitasatospora herbaricolor]MDQ0306015.1 hypothetical protein [Kitasatospora herbaricolor]